MDTEIEDNIHVAIMKDNLKDFIKLVNDLKEWDNYFIKDFDEFFIHTAIRNKSINILNFMLDKNADLKVKERNNKTPLHLSLEEGLCEIAQRIMDSVSEYNKDVEGNNELHKWVLHHSSCEKCLKSLGHSKNSFLTDRNNKGNNPLHQAVIEEDLNAVKLLYAGNIFSFDMNELGENDCTLLHLSAFNKTPEILDYLLSLEFIDINQKNAKLQTALTISLISENYSISEKLISLGARVTSSDKRTAYEKSNKSLYSKLKQAYEEQQTKGRKRTMSFNNTSNNLSNAENKSIVIVNKDEEDVQMDQSNNSVKRMKYSQDFKLLLRKGNTINLDSNSNNSNSNNSVGITERFSISSKESGLSTKNLLVDKKFMENIKRESDAKTPVNPFTHPNPFNKSSKDLISKHPLPYGSGSSNSLNSSNSPVKARIANKGPIIATLSSNFFNLKNGSNNCISPNIPSSVSSSLYNGDQINLKRIPNCHNVSLNFDCFINFEFIKSFTTLEVKELIKEELIYSAEICKVYKGKYLFLPVAIKEYNVAKLKDEESVKLN